MNLQTQSQNLGRASGKLLSLLRAQVLSGRMSAGEFMPSVRELSEQQKLACNTVQHALRSLVAEGLLAAVPRRGYRVLARANHAERACPIAIVLESGRETWDPLQRNLVENLQIAAARRGQSLLAVGADRSSPEEVVRQLLGARAWGALLNLSDPALVELLGQAGMPVVMVEQLDTDPTHDAVVQDGFLGAMLAGACLAERGHDRIAWIGPPLIGSGLQITERYSGAMGGLSRFGKRLAEELCVEVPVGDADAAREAARRLLSLPCRPTAMLALWQPFAQAVVQAARESNLVPGRDFDMVGWWTEEAYDLDYTPMFAGGPVPPAVTWSVTTMAEIAMSRIEERRAKPTLPVIHLRIPTRLRFAAEGQVEAM